ncbi:MAG: YwnF family protein, partial [Bacillaceae bacterium]|nr:YwnF family protein [Bacillaceae bacterium]
DHVSSYTKKEFEKMQSRISPLVKKSTIFTVASISLISISFINLYYLLFGHVSNMVLTVVFSILGAVGMALYKEVKFQNKEIYNTSINYIKERIMKSEIVPDYTRDRFIEKVSSEPMNAFQTFSEFLHQEERMKKLGNS